MAGYVPIATIAKLGGVIPDGISIFVTADGVISVDPAQLVPGGGAEGDVLYFHSGAWHLRHIAGAGTVLTSDGADPGWAETVLPMAHDGVLVGTRHELDIDDSPYFVITATDDPIADAVHYLLSPSPAFLALLTGLSATTVIVSDTTALALSLWNGSGNDPPPAGFQTGAFVDAGWPAAVISCDEEAGVVYIAGTHIVWSPSGRLEAETALLRKHFALPAGVITSATLQVQVDDHYAGVWINGTFIGSQPSIVRSPVVQTYSVPVGILNAGAGNVIAVEATNDAEGTGPCTSSGGGGGISFGLTVVQNTPAASGGTGGTLPAGVEGDILYFHAGAWIGLHIGPAGDYLQSNGTDPAWGPLGVNVSLSDTLVGVEPGVNLIPGANVGLTVVDNPTHARVDVTIAGAAAAPAGTAQSGHVAITIAAGSATNTATVAFGPAFAAAPDVIVSSESGLVIASAESITRTGFVARVTANVPLAPGTSLTAILHWTVGGPSLRGRFKPPLLKLYR